MSTRLEILNPWIGATSSVLGAVLEAEPLKGQLSMLGQPFTGSQVSVIIRVSGDFSGVVMFGMGLITADRLASVMLVQQVKSFDQLAANALASLVHRVAHVAHAEFCNSGINCEFSSPAIIKGSRVELHDLALPAVVVPLATSLGEIQLTVGLCQRSSARAA